MQRDLQGRRILITGASSGIGLALAEQLAQAGTGWLWRRVRQTGCTKWSRYWFPRAPTPSPSRPTSQKMPIASPARADPNPVGRPGRSRQQCRRCQFGAFCRFFRRYFAAGHGSQLLCTCRIDSPGDSNLGKGSRTGGSQHRLQMRPAARCRPGRNTRPANSPCADSPRRCEANWRASTSTCYSWCPA